MKPKISIIVPIFNMEKLMRRCIDSLLAQTFTDFECILIDDGSTDGSWCICQEYEKTDSRIKIFHKVNGGLSDTRNYGLERAAGKYTIFADPDDYVSIEGLDQLYETAEKEQADITICDAYYEDEYSRKYVSQRPTSLTAHDLQRELFTRIQGYTWNKLIRRDVYTRFGIKYPVEIYGCEDQYAMALMLMHNLKIAYVPVAFYHYMYNPKSLSRHYDERTFQMDKHIYQMFSDLLHNSEALPYAQRDKRNAIIYRAFLYGKGYFTNKSFKKYFRQYLSVIPDLPFSFFLRLCILLSCLGGYTISRHIFGFGFNLKQLYKKLIAE